MLEMLASVQKVFISVGQISQEASLFDSTACSLWDTGLVKDTLRVLASIT